MSECQHCSGVSSFSNSEAVHRQKPKSPQTFLQPESKHFQMCHSADVNELLHLTPTLKLGTKETIFYCLELLRCKPAHQVGKLQVIAEAVESSLVLVERLK